MAFQQLIMCVDNSGSMRGPKIQNAMNALNSIASSMRCNTKYFRFGNRVEQISEYTKNTLPCGDGTRIEACLNDLFNSKLRQFAGTPTKFIFVTDAADSIKNANGVIAAKRACESAYGQRLSPYCLLVGPGGGCSSELKQIFGANSFDLVNGNKFKSELQNMSGSFQAVGKLENVSGNISSEVQQLANSNNQDIREFGEKANEILRNVAKSKQDTQEAAAKLQQTKQNLNNLDREKTNVVGEVSAVRTDADEDRAEQHVEALKREYIAEGDRVRTAEGLLDSAQKTLQGETSSAEQLAQKLVASTKRLGDRAQLVIGNILKSLEELDKLHKSCVDQATSLKKRFRTDMDDLMDIVHENKNVREELRRIQSNITNSFKDLKQKKIEMSDLQRIVRQNITEMNDLLEQLDDR